MTCPGRMAEDFSYIADPARYWAQLPDTGGHDLLALAIVGLVSGFILVYVAARL